MCEYCSDIADMENFTLALEKIADNTVRSKITIVRQGNNYSIQSCESGKLSSTNFCIDNIKYCPYCGRKLAED